MMTRSACYPKRALFHPGRNQGFVLTDCSGLKNISFIDIPLSPYGLPAAKSTLDSFSRMLPPTHYYFLTRTFHSMRISAFSDISLCASFYHILYPPLRFFINSFLITDRNHDNPYRPSLCYQLIYNPVTKAAQFDFSRFKSRCASFTYSMFHFIRTILTRFLPLCHPAPPP